MRKKTTNSSGSGPELPLENIEEATVAKTGTAMNRNAAPTRAKTMIGTRVPLSLPSRRSCAEKACAALRSTGAVSGVGSNVVASVMSHPRVRP